MLSSLPFLSDLYIPYLGESSYIYSPQLFTQEEHAHFSPLTGEPNMLFLVQSGLLMKAQSRWRQIGLMLNQSDYLESYANQFLNKDFDCVTKVFQAWLDNGGSPGFDTTWDGLRSLLQIVGLGGFAKDKKI